MESAEERQLNKRLGEAMGARWTLVYKGRRQELHHIGQIPNGQYVCLRIYHQNEGLDEKNQPVKVYRLISSWVNEFYGLAKYIQTNIFNPHGDEPFRPFPLVEFSFLMDEADLVINWILDNLLSVSEIPDWDDYHCNLEVGKPLKYYHFTRRGWAAVRRRVSEREKLKENLKRRGNLKR
jgi:hypothetical protein